eukprot:gene21225-25552_t
MADQPRKCHVTSAVRPTATFRAPKRLSPTSFRVGEADDAVAVELPRGYTGIGTPSPDSHSHHQITRPALYQYIYTH